MILTVLISVSAPSARAQQHSPVFSDLEHALYRIPLALAESPSNTQQPDPPASGTVTGRIVDVKGAPLVGAHVTLSRPDSSASREALTGDDGQFSFTNIAAGPFTLTVSGAGFATQEFIGMVRPGESFAVPQITLPVATNFTEVRVTPPTVEIAETEMKAEEKQRVLGVLPNFYVSYVPNAAPLSSKQKFKLAWKSTIDPSNFVITGVVAGMQQADNDFGGYGQGADGYAKRYGANFADSVASTFIGGALFPSLFKQDPRYFYKGTGSFRSRLLHALSHSVVCKGDNGQPQPNYSNFLGGFAAGGISNLYYPDDKTGAGLTFENAAISIASGAAMDVLQEFVIHRFTTHVPTQSNQQP